MSTDADPRMLAAAGALLSAGVCSDLSTALPVASVVLAAADAVPADVRMGHALSSTAMSARAVEQAVGGALRWQAAFARVTLAVIDAWQGAGMDASLLLGCLPAELEEVARAVWQTSQPLVVTVAHVAALVTDDSVPEPVQALLADADEGRWRERYRLGVRALAANLLPPAELTDDEWAEFLCAELADLRAMVERVALLVDAGDWAAAGVVADDTGRYPGLLEED